MKIIGRKEELRELERCARSGKSELICVYGRRRVGKTFLVEQFFSGYFAFRATGVEGGKTRTQLKSFHQRLREHGDMNGRIPADWFEAFSRLESILASETVRRSPHGKIVVFLDEFPWFATAKSDFLMAFGEFWNRCGTAKGDYLFIICGSATSWIIGNVLKNTGSMYNRVTSQIFLNPFTLKESEAFFKDREFDWSRKQITQCQMVFGGLPYFFDLLNGNESLSWNIDMLCFRPHAMLRDESKRLLEATLRKSPVYEQVLEFLSRFPYGVKREDCFRSLSIPQGTFARTIDDLAGCGYIQEYKNYHEKKNPLYLRLSDPFLLFHYSFLKEDSAMPFTSFSEFVSDTGRYMNWRGHAFESLCLSHIRQIKTALGILGVKTVSYPWASRIEKGGAQIDLIIERDDMITDLCEIKYTDSPFSISADYERVLLHKRDVFRKETGAKHALKLVMISAEGIAGVAHTEHIARVLTLDDLFES